MDKTHFEQLNPEKAICGTLYIVATPIGNLEDMTFRAVKVLQNVDLIAAESAEYSRRLCKHYGIQTKRISYNQHNHRVRAAKILRQLQAGRQVALITNAGTPGISDPGTLLVSQAVEQGIPVSPIPGPSAVTLALSATGLRSDCYYFGGFLSPRPGKRKKELQVLASMPWTLVFYEAPQRLSALLADLLEIMGDRSCVIWREMTKMHEEALRGSVGSILKQVQYLDIKGEITLVLAGAPNTGVDKRFCEDEVIERIRQMLEKERKGVKEIATRLARERGLAYRNVYKMALALKGKDKL
jgi:16S rRNA (cytidine1402-2'-O)-methyltransferase